MNQVVWNIYFVARVKFHVKIVTHVLITLHSGPMTEEMTSHAVRMTSDVRGQH